MLLSTMAGCVAKSLFSMENGCFLSAEAALGGLQEYNVVMIVFA
jgi:hypothetical protein